MAKLTFEQAIDLMPVVFQPYERLNGRAKRLKTPLGIVQFHHSSLLRDGLYKTSHNEDEIKNEIDFILYALGYDGILVLHRNTLLSFFDKNVTSRYSNNRYPIHILPENGKYIWIGRDGYRMDMTEYFYPNRKFK